MRWTSGRRGSNDRDWDQTPREGYTTVPGRSRSGRPWPGMDGVARVGDHRPMNEWVAFGIVAGICTLLAVLMRFASDGDEPR